MGPGTLFGFPVKLVDLVDLERSMREAYTKATQAIEAELVAILKQQRWRWFGMGGELPPPPMDAAKAVWETLWPGEPWPDGWIVEWVRPWQIPFPSSMGATLGYCDRAGRRVALNWDELVGGLDAQSPLDAWFHNMPKCPLYTLVHELLHARGLDHRSFDDHQAFHVLTQKCVAELWKEAL